MSTLSDQWQKEVEGKAKAKKTTKKKTTKKVDESQNCNLCIGYSRCFFWYP